MLLELEERGGEKIDLVEAEAAAIAEDEEDKGRREVRGDKRGVNVSQFIGRYEVPV